MPPKIVRHLRETLRVCDAHEGFEASQRDRGVRSGRLSADSPPRAIPLRVGPLQPPGRCAPFFVPAVVILETASPIASASACRKSVANVANASALGRSSRSSPRRNHSRTVARLTPTASAAVGTGTPRRTRSTTAVERSGVRSESRAMQVIILFGSAAPEFGRTMMRPPTGMASGAHLIESPMHYLDRMATAKLL